MSEVGRGVEYCHCRPRSTSTLAPSSPDPNVEVLYVSPLPVDEEMQDYYHRLLAMGPGGEEASQRVHFITPEQIGKFPGHRMSLSTILLYSTQTAERLRHLTAGREAYIVPNVVSRDDLAVADMLGAWIE